MAGTKGNSGGARPGAGRPRKHESKYERSEFTPEQLVELLSSPHVAYVSRSTISYTQAFKEMVWQRYCDGIHPTQIFEDAGINPDILGRIRVKGLVDSLRQQKEKGLSFNEGREPHVNQPEKQFEFPKPPRRPNHALPISPTEAAKLTHQVSYLSQELEFIKKIILAGRDGK